MLAQPTYSVPGVYRQPHVRAESFPRLRTDVVGFVGCAGTRFLDEAVRIDDWRSYIEFYLKDEKGHDLVSPTGSRLASTVREFFANGGSRCWVVNISDSLEPSGRQALLNKMLGLNSLDEQVGLELLLRQEEVCLIVLPELDATHDKQVEQPQLDIPGSPCFERCRNVIKSAVSAPATLTSGEPLYEDSEILWAQRYLISRLQKERWRWFAILSTPRDKNYNQAIQWRHDLVENLGDCDVAALYWPWIKTQDKPGAMTKTRSPVGHIAGVFARKDITRGPHIAPANESLFSVVGLEQNVDDRTNALVYDAGVNVIRSFAGRGIKIWGARTLLWRDTDSRFDALAFVNGRRCLTAIARTAYVLGQQIVFQPNTVILRAQLSQTLVGYLMSVFQSGALLGDTPEQAFYVVCDSNNNSTDAHDQGQLFCDVGVALAAPAEFIVFRVGRKNAVTEIEEAA